jgi:hypothetical protein
VRQAPYGDQRGTDISEYRGHMMMVAAGAARLPGT